MCDKLYPIAFIKCLLKKYMYWDNDSSYHHSPSNHPLCYLLIYPNDERIHLYIMF